MTNPSTRRDLLRTVAAAASTVGVSVLIPSLAAGESGDDGWAIGPFVKRDQPVLRPTPDSRFKCPIRGKEVRWEERNVYNPAAVVREGKAYLLYRADDRSPDLGWGRTCRIGLACSEDGVNFTRHGELYWSTDFWHLHVPNRLGVGAEQSCIVSSCAVKANELLEAYHCPISHRQAFPYLPDGCAGPPTFGPHIFRTSLGS